MDIKSIMKKKQYYSVNRVLVIGLSAILRILSLFFCLVSTFVSKFCVTFNYYPNIFLKIHLIIVVITMLIYMTYHIVSL